MDHGLLIVHCQTDVCKSALFRMNPGQQQGGSNIIMSVRRLIGFSMVAAVFVAKLGAASSDAADAAMNKNKDALRALLQKTGRRRARR